MHHMSTVGIRDLQHRLKEVLDAVVQGDTIVVTRRNRPVARIVPFDGPGAEPWPDLMQRLRGIYGRSVLGESASTTVYNDRGDG